jgi:hypothetical protein
MSGGLDFLFNKDNVLNSSWHTGEAAKDLTGSYVVGDPIITGSFRFYEAMVIYTPDGGNSSPEIEIKVEFSYDGTNWAQETAKTVETNAIVEVQTTKVLRTSGQILINLRSASHFRLSVKENNSPGTNGTCLIQGYFCMTAGEEATALSSGGGTSLTADELAAIQDINNLRTNPESASNPFACLDDLGALLTDDELAAIRDASGHRRTVESDANPFACMDDVHNHDELISWLAQGTADVGTPEYDSYAIKMNSSAYYSGVPNNHYFEIFNRADATNERGDLGICFDGGSDVITINELGDIWSDGNAAIDGYIKAGTGSPASISEVAGDIFVSNQFECADLSYFKNNVEVYGKLTATGEVRGGSTGANGDFLRGYSSGFHQSILYDQTVFWATSVLGNQLIFFGGININNRDEEFAHAARDEFVIYLHSHTSPTVATDEYISFLFNTTDAEILTGKGGIIQTAPSSAPTITGNSQLTWWLDEVNNKLKGTARYSDSTDKVVSLPFGDNWNIPGFFSVGAGTPNRISSVVGDAYITNELEVDGDTYLDGHLYMDTGGVNSKINCKSTIKAMYGGATGDTFQGFGWSILQYSTWDQIVFEVGTNQGRQIIFTDNAEGDYQHAMDTNFAMYIHSVTDPDTDATEYIKFQHNQTDALGLVGKGGWVWTFPDSAPTLTGNSQGSIHLDETGGNVVINVKESDGSTHSVTLEYGTHSAD